MPQAWVISPWITERGPINTHRRPLASTVPDNGRDLVDDDERTFRPPLRCRAYPSDVRRGDVSHDEAVCLLSGVSLAALRDFPTIKVIGDIHTDDSYLEKTPRQEQWTGNKGETYSADEPIRDVVNRAMVRSAPERLLK